MTAAAPDLENECFFIAPIGADGSPERKRSDGVLKYIVARAAEELGLTAVRADQIAEPGQITLQVVEHVLGARAAVVDLTGLNANVFYEMAVRHTARLPVVLIAEKGCALPFDIAQMRTIFFEHTDLASADACRSEIVSHLREALEGGSVDSPIATTIDVRALQSGSAAERNIAELVTAVEDIARTQRSTLHVVDRLRADRTQRPPLRYLRELSLGVDRFMMFAHEAGNDDMVSEGARLHNVIERLADPRVSRTQMFRPPKAESSESVLDGARIAHARPEQALAEPANLDREPDRGGG